jgi:hypothetical protein
MTTQMPGQEPLGCTLTAGGDNIGDRQHWPCIGSSHSGQEFVHRLMALGTVSRSSREGGQSTKLMHVGREAMTTGVDVARVGIVVTETQVAELAP